MATKVKGFFKSVKLLKQNFVVKENDIEIGYPTDVKHIGHIAWDNTSIDTPNWMKSFQTPYDISSEASFISIGESSWISKDHGNIPRELQPSSLESKLEGTPTTMREIKRSRRRSVRVSSPLSRYSRRQQKTRSSSSSSSCGIVVEEERRQSNIDKLQEV